MKITGWNYQNKNAFLTHRCLIGKFRPFTKGFAFTSIQRRETSVIYTDELDQIFDMFDNRLIDLLFHLFISQMTLIEDDRFRIQQIR